MCNSIITGKDPLARSVRYQYNRTPSERAPQAKNYHRPYQEEWIQKYTHNSCSSWVKVQFVKDQCLGVPKAWLWALAFCVWQSLMSWTTLAGVAYVFITSWANPSLLYIGMAKVSITSCAIPFSVKGEPRWLCHVELKHMAKKVFPLHKYGQKLDSSHETCKWSGSLHIYFIFYFLSFQACLNLLLGSPEGILLITFPFNLLQRTSLTPPPPTKKKKITALQG